MARHQFPETSKTRGFAYEAMYLERLIPYRAHVATVLLGDGFAKRYVQLLGDALQKAETLFGRRFSANALIVCVFLSLIYSYILFWLGAAGGWENPLASAAGLEKLSSLSIGSRWSIFLYATLAPMLMWPLGRFIGYREKRFKVWLRRKRQANDRKQWARAYTILTIGAFIGLPILVVYSVPDSSEFLVGYFVVFLFMIGPLFGAHWGGRAPSPWRALWISIAGAGALALAGAGAGAGAGALAVAVAVAVAVAGAGSVASLSVRPGMRRVNLFAAIVGGFFGLTALAILTIPNEKFSLFLIITAIILPLFNGSIDFFSWWFSRWMGEKLHRVLTTVHDTAHRVKTALLHGLADVGLALIFFVGLAWALGFVFELFDLWGDLKEVELWEPDGESGYITEIFNDPLGTGLWITLMLFSTLIPTVIHLGFVITALIPMILLPDRQRLQLADDLQALAEKSADKPLDQKSITIIRKAASYASAYRRRVMISGFAAVSLLIALGSLCTILHWGLGLDKAAYWAGINGIECARWIWNGA